MKRFLDLFKWLYPGMRVKRWFVVVFAGSLMTSAGIILALNFTVIELLNWIYNLVINHASRFLPLISLPAGFLLLALGSLTIAFGIRQIVRSITSVVSPGNHGRLADIVYRRRFLAQGERIVVIGGGTGLATMLRGLKEYSSNITAVVTVSDEGGSSGRLVREYGMLPPGDIRNCITALADEEDLMAKLLEFRFNGDGNDLTGHSMGNLLLAAMTQISGNFDTAVRETSRVLAIRGRVLPSTLDHVHLRAILKDGSVAEGEVNIVEAGKSHPIEKLTLVPAYAKALPEVVDAIEKAAAIVIGPGSLYTSVLPNLLLPEVRSALKASRAQRIYVCNVMTQPGETDGFTASDHVKALAENSDPRLFDIVFVNQTRPSDEIRRRYEKQGASWVEPDVDKIRQMGYRVIRGPFMNEGDVVRHDAESLARAILYMLR